MPTATAELSKLTKSIRKNRGGARPGAGRPPKSTGTQRDPTPILTELLNGHSATSIGQRHDIHPATVHAIALRNPDRLATIRQKLQDQALSLAGKAFAQAEATLPAASSLQAATVAGIATQRALNELADNQPTSNPNAANFTVNVDARQLHVNNQATQVNNAQLEDSNKQGAELSASQPPATVKTARLIAFLLKSGA